MRLRNPVVVCDATDWERGSNSRQCAEMEFLKPGEDVFDVRGRLEADGWLSAPGGTWFCPAHARVPQR